MIISKMQLYAEIVDISLETRQVGLFLFCAYARQVNSTSPSISRQSIAGYWSGRTALSRFHAHEMGDFAVCFAKEYRSVKSNYYRVLGVFDQDVSSLTTVNSESLCFSPPHNILRLLQAA